MTTSTSSDQSSAVNAAIASATSTQSASATTARQNAAAGQGVLKDNILRSDQMLAASTWQQSPEALFARVSDHYLVDESAYVSELVGLLNAEDKDAKRIGDKTAELVREIRAMDTAVDSIDELLQQYSLDTQEGVLLMCLAEALLRIPDKETADALIEDKLGVADWKSHLGQSESWFVNASTWGLLMTGNVIKMDLPKGDGKPATFHQPHGQPSR